MELFTTCGVLTTAIRSQTFSTGDAHASTGSITGTAGRVLLRHLPRHRRRGPGSRHSNSTRLLNAQLGPGQSHDFTVTLEENTLVQLVVEQRGIDVVVKVSSPDGKSLGDFDSPNGEDGPENVSFVAVTAGAYRITVSSADSGRLGVQASTRSRSSNAPGYRAGDQSQQEPRSRESKRRSRCSTRSRA